MWTAINKDHPKKQEIVVVTGASSGIGAATARELARRGFHVFAGVRRSEDAQTLSAPNLEPVLLDITNEVDIAALVQRISADPDKRSLRALVNNAGVAVNAPIEAYALSDWRHLFEVNLFGHVAMIQALLPELIASRGTVVNISSVGGKISMATYGPYAGTKFALEAVSDSLRREVGILGVKVVVIEPGAVNTGMLREVDLRGERILSGMTEELRGRYTVLMRAVIKQAQASAAGGATPEEAGRIIAEAITSKRPRARYTVGRSTATLIQIVRLLSDRMLDRMLAASLRPHYPKSSKT